MPRNYKIMTDEALNAFVDRTKVVAEIYAEDGAPNAASVRYQWLSEAYAEIARRRNAAFADSLVEIEKGGGCHGV